MRIFKMSENFVTSSVFLKQFKRLQPVFIFVISVSSPLVPRNRQILEYLAHLSQRLIGELIGYSWSGVRPSSLTISNIFFFKTACPIKAQFNLEPPWVGGTKVCSRHLGNMTKMAAMPIYGKNP